MFQINQARKVADTRDGTIQAMANDMAAISKESPDGAVTTDDLRRKGWSRNLIDIYGAEAVERLNQSLNEAAPRSLDAGDTVATVIKPQNSGKSTAPLHEITPTMIPAGLKLLVGIMDDKAKAVAQKSNALQDVMGRNDRTLTRIDGLVNELKFETGELAALNRVMAAQMASLKSREPLRGLRT